MKGKKKCLRTKSAAAIRTSITTRKVAVAIRLCAGIVTSGGPLGPGECVLIVLLGLVIGARLPDDQGGRNFYRLQ